MDIKILTMLQPQFDKQKDLMETDDVLERLRVYEETNKQLQFQHEWVRQLRNENDANFK